MAFDREAAKRAGYSEQEIDAYLASKRQPIKQTQPVYDPFGARGSGPLEAILQGATLGFSDEMQAGAKTAFDKLTGDDRSWSEIYKENVKEVRAPYEEFQQEAPMTALGLGLGGGLVTGGLGAKTLAAKAPQQITRYAQTHPMLAKMAGGTSAGIVSGVGMAPTVEEIPEYVTSGALTGGLLPPALTAGGKVGQVVTKPIQAGARALAGSLDTPVQRASKMIVRALQRDDISFDEAMKRLDDLGPEAKLVDIGGVNVQRLMQNIASVPGKAAQKAEDVLQGRMIQSPQRLVARLRNEFKQNKSAYRFVNETIEQRKQASSPLYAKAFNEDVMVAPGAMDEMLAGLAMKIDDFQGTSIGRTLKGVERSLTLKRGDKMVPKLNIKKLHAAKIDLDNKIANSYKDHRATPLTAELMEQKRALLNVLDGIDGNSNYAQARRIFSDDSSVINATRIGKQILKQDSDEMADLIQDMSEAEKRGFISGAMQSISDKLMGTSEGANAARKFATPLVKGRLRNMFPDEDEYNRFIKGLEAEDTFAEVRNNVLRGSQTQQRLATGEQVADEAMDLVQGRWLSSSLDAARKFFTGYRQIPEPVRDELSELLLADVMTGKGTISKEMAKLLKRLDISTNIVNRLLDTLRQGMPVAAGELGPMMEQ